MGHLQLSSNWRRMREENHGTSCKVNAAGPKRETTSDWSLLKRIAQEDEEALSALYDRYSGLVFSTAKRILYNSGEAEEVLQNVFYQVWCTAARFDPAKGSFAGWLLVTARNQAIAKLRSKDVHAEDLDENGVWLPVDMESHSDQKLLGEKVRSAMAGVAEDQREAMEYAYFEGISFTEMEQKTAQPLQTLPARLHVAMDALKKVLR